MPDNNFEDEVRKKMEELRFVPSGDVWTKVEENIREDRKRRRMFFWLPLTGLLVGGMLWFGWPAKKAADQANRRTETINVPVATDQASSDAGKTKTQKANAPSSAADASSSQAPEPVNAARNTAGPQSGAGTGTEDAGAAATARDNSTITQLPAAVTATGNRRKKISPVITTEAEYLANISGATDKSKQQANKPSNSRNGTNAGKHAAIIAEQEKTEAIAPENLKITGEPVTGSAEEKTGKETGDVVSAKKDSNTSANATNASAVPEPKAAKPSKNEVMSKPATPAIAAKTKKKKGIEWGFTASGGITSQIERNAIPTGVLARAFANSSVYLIQKSDLTPGPAFSVGFAAAKQIGKTWRLQTGFQYAYASSRLPNSVNLIYPTYNAAVALNGGLASGFSAVNSENKHYSNRYQFFQTPVAVEKQFGVNSPLSVQAGLNFGYLRSVHAVIYQPLLDQYSADNSKFNKVQVSGLVGAYWKFRIDPNWSLRAGPELQYQLGNFMKNTVSVNDHLLTGAVRVILLHSAK